MDDAACSTWTGPSWCLDFSSKRALVNTEAENKYAVFRGNVELAYGCRLVLHKFIYKVPDMRGALACLCIQYISL